MGNNSIRQDLNEYVEQVQKLSILLKNDDIDPEKISLLDILENFLGLLISYRNNFIDLDTAGNFLVAVSNMILMKSSLLLPVVQTNDDDVDSQENEEEKAKYWREYKKYQSLLPLFEKRAKMQKDIYFTALKLDNTVEETYHENTFSDILLALEKVLTRKKTRNSIKVKKNVCNIIQKMNAIEAKFIISNKLTFESMVKNDNTKIEIVITFLALLELICQGKVSYFQSVNFGEIIFYYKGERKSKKKVN